MTRFILKNRIENPEDLKSFSWEGFEFNESLSDEKYKRGNENRLYTARRRTRSAALFYKAENEPWTLRSMRPYLRQAGAEALLGAMPFLERSGERRRLEEGRERKKTLEAGEAQALRTGDRAGLREIRAEETALLQDQNRLGAILFRKDREARLFFRKVNYAFDIQKARMFEFYREQRARRIAAGEERETAPTENPEQDGSKQK